MIKKVFIILNVFILFTGCQKFVENTSPSINAVSYDEINNEDNIEFFINGVKNAYADAHARVSVIADGISDQLVHDRNVAGATGPSDEALDNGDYEFTDGSKAECYFSILEVWRTAKLLKESLDILEGGEIEKEGYYTAYLYQGLAYYLLGTYYGRGPSYPIDGGATIDTSSFIPSSELYNTAIAHFQSALNSLDAGDDYKIRVLNSLMSRIYLYGGDPTLAAAHASQGLIAGDDPFQALYTDEGEFINRYYNYAGEGRTRWTLDSRFRHLLGEEFTDAGNGNGVYDQGEGFTDAGDLNGTYDEGEDFIDLKNGVYDWGEEFVDIALPGGDTGSGNGVYDEPTEPEESIRLPMAKAPMEEDAVSYVRYYQEKYESDSPISVISWQENHLILAELGVQGYGIGIDALGAVNDIRNWYSLPLLTEISMEIILDERDKELFCEGKRLIDQNRFSDLIPWHTGELHYIPIPLEEELTNPNYP